MNEARMVIEVRIDLGAIDNAIAWTNECRRVYAILDRENISYTVK